MPAPAKKKNAKWADIFKDKENFADDFVIAVKAKDGTEMSYTLGDLREYNEDNEGALLQSLEDRENAIKTDQQKVAAAQNQLSTIVQGLAAETGENVDELVTRLKAGKKVTKKEVTKATGVEEDDPLFGEVFKKVNEFRGETDGKIQSLVSLLDTMRQTTLQVTNAYLDDYYENKFEKIMASAPEKGKKDLSVDKLKKEAEKKGYKDNKGRLDLARASKDLFEPFVTEDWREAERKKIRKELQDEQRVAAVPKPGSVPERLPKPTIDVSKSKDPLSDAFNAALNDDEMWKQLVPETSAA